MTKKSKILISVLSILLIGLIAAVTTVGVLAAGPDSLTSNVQVSYVANNFAGIAKANYYAGTGEAIPMRVDGLGGDSLEFDTSDRKYNNFIPQNGINVELGKKCQFVVFEFVFYNNGGDDISATLAYIDDDVDDTNIVKTINTDGVSLKDSSNWIDSIADPVPTLRGTGNIIKNAVIKAGQSQACFYVLVKIQENAEASFSGEFRWTLNSAKTV